MDVMTTVQPQRSASLRANQPIPLPDAATPSAADETVRAGVARRRWRRVRWAVRIAVLAVLIGYPFVVGLDSWFYYPDSQVYWQPADFGLAHEDVHLRAADGVRLHGWWLPATRSPRGVVVHFHGNAANITNHIALAAWLPTQGYHTLMFDYRGYGRSEGRVNRAGTIEDGRAAVALAAERARAAGLPLLVYGQSLGGAVAIVVAAERPEVRAVVAEATFGRYRGIAARHGRGLVLLPWLAGALSSAWISSGYDPLDYVGQIAPRPLLVIAGERDEICFPELGRELYDAAGEPKEWWLVPSATRLAILDEHGGELVERITDFFSRAAGG